MAIILNFVIYYIISNIGIWLAKTILKFPISKESSIVLSLFFPTTVLISYEIIGLEKVLNLLMGTTYFDFDIESDWRGAASLIVVVIFYGLITISITTLVLFCIIKSLRILKSEKKNSYGKNVAKTLFVVLIGFVIDVVLVRLISII